MGAGPAGYNRPVFRAARAPLFLAIAAIVAAVALVRAVSADATADESSLADILLSRQLMEDAGVRVGEVVTLAADPQGLRSRQFRVIAGYEPTPNPMRFSARRLEARLHLPDLMALTTNPADPLSSEAISALNVVVADRRDAAAVAAEVMTPSPGILVRTTSGRAEEGEVFEVVERFHWAVAVVTVVGSTAFLLALMVIRAEERRDIVGILRLMGIPPRSILVEVLCEGLLIALAGAVFGILVAFAGQDVVNRIFQWRYDTTLRFVQVTFRIACQSVALAVPLGVLAGLAASSTLLGRDVLSLIRR